MKDVYLDGASNTPLSRAALKAMKPFLSNKHVGNGVSVHSFGVKSGMAIEKSRRVMSDLLGVSSKELFFTSGATESNNWAIWSEAIKWREQNPTGGHIICSIFEHDSVIKCCEEVGKVFGIDVSYIPKPNNQPGQRREEEDESLRGIVTEKQVKDEMVARIKEKGILDTFLVCVMAVNNELGTTNENEVGLITQYTKSYQIATLVDCTQALSCGGDEICLGRRFPEATYMSFSAHKFYGPTGVGGLIARAELRPLISGGSQEQGLRGGTTNTAGVVGMCAALKEMSEHDYAPLYSELTSYLCVQLLKHVRGAFLNVFGNPNIPIVSINCSKIMMAYSLADMIDAFGISVSAGSACDSNHNETVGEFNGSHVLKALGLTEEDIRNTIRVSYTRYTTKKDIDKLIKALKRIVENY